MTKEGSQCIGPSAILIDSVFITSKNYYPQVFLEEYKYIVWEKRMPEYITAEENSDKEDPDEENS